MTRRRLEKGFTSELNVILRNLETVKEGKHNPSSTFTACIYIKILSNDKDDKYSYIDFNNLQNVIV